MSETPPSVVLYEVDEKKLAGYLRTLADAIDDREAAVRRLETGRRVSTDETIMTKTVTMDWTEPAGTTGLDPLELAEESTANQNTNEDGQ